MTLEEYAHKILTDAGCNEYTYGGDWSKHILDDLKTAFPNGMEYPYVDVANAILAMSRPEPIVRAPYQVVWSNDNATDGFGCESYEDAKDSALTVLEGWMEAQGSEMDYPPTQEQIDDWNYMLYNWYVEIYKYNPMTDEYEEVDGLTYEDEERIGWTEMTYPEEVE